MEVCGTGNAPPSPARGGALASYVALWLSCAWMVARDAFGEEPALAVFLFGGVACGALLVSLLDPLIAWGRPQPSLSAVRLRRVALGSLVALPAVHASAGNWSTLAIGAVWSGAIGLGVAADRLSCRLRLPDPPRFWYAANLAALQLFALSFYVHDTEETFTAVRAGTEALHYGFFAATWLLSCALLVPFTVRILARSGESPQARGWMLWSLGAVVVGVVAAESDRRQLVDLYPGLHVWLALVAVLSLDAGLVPWALRVHRWRGAATRWMRSWSLAGAVSLLSLVGSAIWFATRPPSLGSGLSRAAVAESAIGSSLLGLLPAPVQPPAVAAGPVVLHRALAFEHHRDEPWPGEPPNILLVSVDALRADVLFGPGQFASSMPHTQELAERCGRFRNAYAPGTRTAIGMGAFMMGRYSANVQWELLMYQGGRLSRPDELSPEELATMKRFVYSTLPVVPTKGSVPQRIDAAGYRTMAVPFAGRNEFFTPGSGFELGFDRFVDLTGKKWRLPSSPKVVEQAVTRLGKGKRRPWFLWVHLYDPHQSSGKAGRYRELVGETDRAIGTLLDHLDAIGQRDSTAVVLIADHGEALGEHRHIKHGTSLFDEESKVPMLVCLPGHPGGDFDAPTSTLDAAATMLALAKADTSEIDGVNLLPWMTRGAYPEHRPVFTELHRYTGQDGGRTKDLKGIVRDDWKLIVDRLRDTTHLYNLAVDPGEAENLAGEGLAIEGELRAILESFVGRGEAEFPLP